MASSNRRMTDHTSRGAALENLSEVMLQMRDVVLHKVLERRRLFGGHGAPGEVVQVVPRPTLLSDRRRNRRDDTREVKVERMPETDQLRPRRILVTLGGDPLFLTVAGKDQVIGELSTHETLVVVGGRVDQVAELLLGGPLSRSGNARDILLGKSAQTRFRIGQRAPQLALGGNLPIGRRHFTPPFPRHPDSGEPGRADGSSRRVSSTDNDNAPSSRTGTARLPSSHPRRCYGRRGGTLRPSGRTPSRCAARPTGAATSRCRRARSPAGDSTPAELFHDAEKTS